MKGLILLIRHYARNQEREPNAEISERTEISQSRHLVETRERLGKLVRGKDQSPTFSTYSSLSGLNEQSLSLN